MNFDEGHWPSREIHSADGRTFLYRGADGWIAVFESQPVEENPFRTRELARNHLRAMKVLAS